MASQSPLSLVPKLAGLWITLLLLPLIERAVLGERTYYGLFIGLGLVFVFYGLSIRSIFVFLQHTRRQPFSVWIMFLGWSVVICCVLASFAIGYDLLPHTSEPSLVKSRPLIDYFYYEIMTFTTVGYGDIVPVSVQGKVLAMCTALLGFTHSVTFVALVLQALTHNPPAKTGD
jgi:Ion channel